MVQKPAASVLARARCFPPSVVVDFTSRPLQRACEVDAAERREPRRRRSSRRSGVWAKRNSVGAVRGGGGERKGYGAGQKETRAAQRRHAARRRTAHWPPGAAGLELSCGRW
jgi:hypothetical protein